MFNLATMNEETINKHITEFYKNIAYDPGNESATRFLTKMLKKVERQVIYAAADIVCETDSKEASVLKIHNISI